MGIISIRDSLNESGKNEFTSKSITENDKKNTMNELHSVETHWLSLVVYMDLVYTILSFY
jgi:hypothetical protein